MVVKDSQTLQQFYIFLLNKNFIQIEVYIYREFPPTIIMGHVTYPLYLLKDEAGLRQIGILCSMEDVLKGKH